MLRAFFFCLTLSVGVAADELKLAQLTDVHSGQDHFSEAAFTRACRDARALRPDALLLTGDFADNSYDVAGFYDRFHDDLRLWQTPLRGYSGSLLFAVGNDDFAHNYQTEPEDLRQTYRAFRDVFGEAYYLDELGNGRSPDPLSGFVWLSLNSQIFSRYNRTAQAHEQADATLDWLQGQLRSAAPSGPPVIVLTHIAPSWDLYNRKNAWKLEHLQRLADVIGEYPGQVVVLSGHYHRNHVQAMRPSNPVPILTAGALATKYGYQPNWREYRWQVQTGRSVDAIRYTVHYPQHSEWDQQFEFLPNRIGEFFSRLNTDAGFYRTYVSNIYGHHEKWPTYAEDPRLRASLLDELWVSPQTPVGVPR